METNNILSLNRLTLLMKRHFILNYKGLIIGFASIIGVMAIIGALSSAGSEIYNKQVFVGMFYFVMLVAGLILSSSIFNELHKPEKSIHFLTLPSSSFEKLLNGWLNSTLVYFVISVIAFYIAYYMSAVLAFWWFDVSFEMVNIFDVKFLKFCAIYLSVQSVFFFGAIYFKGQNFLKTVFFLFLLFLFYSLYQTLISAVAFREILVMVLQKRNVEEMISAPGLEEYMETVFLPMFKVLFFYVMPLFFLVLSYIRIKEREV